jgi:hypothetical protein
MILRLRLFIIGNGGLVEADDLSVNVDNGRGPALHHPVRFRLDEGFASAL